MDNIKSDKGNKKVTALMPNEWNFVLYSIWGRVHEDLVMQYSFNLTPEYCLAKGGFPTDQYSNFRLVKLTFEGGWAGYGPYIFPPNTSNYSLSGSGYRDGSNGHHLNFGVPGYDFPRQGGASTDRHNYKAIRLYCSGNTMPKP